MYFKIQETRTARYAVILLAAFLMSVGVGVVNGSEIGELKVVGYQVTPIQAVVGEICYPTGAELQSNEVEPVVAEDVIVQVNGNFSYGDLEQLAVGIGDSGVINLGAVEAGATYHFTGPWYFDRSEIQTLRVSLFVKGGVGHSFGVAVINIIAKGQVSGVYVPVYGLPIGGGDIKIVGASSYSADLTLYPESETAVVGEAFTVNGVVENSGATLPRSIVQLFFIGADKSVLRFSKIVPQIPQDGIWGGKLADIEITKEMAIVEEFWLVAVLKIKEEILDIEALKILVVSKPEPSAESK